MSSNSKHNEYSIKVTDKKGKFVGGAAARRKVGHKIQNPMVREKLKTAIGCHVHPQERLFASILRSMPRDILKSHNFPFYRDQLRTDMCQRVNLPMLAPLKCKYNSMAEFNQAHATIVLEEARFTIAEALFKRWGKDRIPPETGLELEFLSHEKISGGSADHLIYFFQARRDLSLEMKSQLRAGTVVELMPIGRHSDESMVLGNIVRRQQRDFIDSDNFHADRQIAVMIYNKSGEQFEDGVRLITLDSLLNLTRQFDVCTNGNNDLSGELLGVRRKQPVHIKFSDTYGESESSDESDSDSDDSSLEVIEIQDSDSDLIVKTEENVFDAIAMDDSDDEKLVEQEDERVVVKMENVIEEDTKDGTEEETKDGPEESTTVKTEEMDNGQIVNAEALEAFVKVEDTNDESIEREEVNQECSIEPKSSDTPQFEQTAVDARKDEEDEKDDPEDKLLADAHYYVPKLNSTQKKAARGFLDSIHQRISIVQGPPGTGKTTLLVSVICRYLLRAKQASKHKRLLVCAPTNKAVTVVANRVLHAIRDDHDTSVCLIGDQERLLADNRTMLRRFFVYTWKDAMIEDWDRIAKNLKTGSRSDEPDLVRWALQRLSNIKRQAKQMVEDDVQSTMSKIHAGLTKLIDGSDTSSLVEEIERLIKKLKSWEDRSLVETLLAEANIIFCTLTSAGAQIMKETVAVDDAIVDEAAAATVPELCIGLWLVNHRLMLVGDPHQLPASVSAEYGKQNGLDISLQDRLMNQCNFPYTMLDVQYRMKKEISKFPFQAFYEGRVSDGDNVLAFSYKPDASLLDSSPYAFVQVQGEEQRDRFGSCYNAAECDIVVGLLEDLRQRSRHVGNDWSNVNRVRVITFYQAQVAEIKRRLRQAGLQNVVVSTVDSSQGCEADIIVISFVRSEKVGFLSDYRRLNVALTRAKHQLVCVGNVQTLATLTSEKAQVISNLAKDAVQRQSVVTDYGPPPRQPPSQKGRKTKQNNKSGMRDNRKRPPPKNGNFNRHPPNDGSRSQPRGRHGTGDRHQHHNSKNRRSQPNHGSRPPRKHVDSNCAPLKNANRKRAQPFLAQDDIFVPPDSNWKKMKKSGSTK